MGKDFCAVFSYFFFSQQDAVSFKVISFANAKYLYAVHDEHRRGLNQLKARTTVLSEIIERHKPVWAPISAAERAKSLQVIEKFKAIYFAAKAIEDSSPQVPQQTGEKAQT